MDDVRKNRCRLMMVDVHECFEYNSIEYICSAIVFVELLDLYMILYLLVYAFTSRNTRKK